MSIAELIMQGTKRTSDSNAGVGDSLIKLGQQVGAALAEREQNKQAQEILPYLQQSMQESMKLAQDGDTAGAYSNMMGIFAANPDLMRNKVALPFFELGLKGINESANTYQQKQIYNQRQSYYDKVTANKTGGDENTFDIEGFVNALNPQEEVEVDETINPEGINPVVAGGMPGMRLPTESIQTQRGMGMTPKSITDQAAGLPASTPTETSQTRDEVDAAAAAKLPTKNATEPLARGPLDPANPKNALFPDLPKEPPPKNVLEGFIKFEDRFAALSFEKQKAEMDTNSIIFADQKMLDEYKPSKGRGIIQISPAASVGIPGLTGAVEIPERYSKFIIGSVNVNPATGSQSYNLKKEVKNDPEAKAALSWLNQWQETSINVSSNPDLAGLLSQAGNDALAIDIKPLAGSYQRGSDQAELSVKEKPESKITVTKEAADQIAMLKTQTAAANIHDAKFIRLKVAPQATAQPAKTKFEEGKIYKQGGIKYKYTNAQFIPVQ